MQLHFVSCNTDEARRRCSSAALRCTRHAPATLATLATLFSAALRCTRHAPATLATLFSAVPLSASPLPRDLPHAAAAATASIVAAAR